ncbi:MAG: hypothetical protein RIE52_01360 [Balneola sp.]
MKTHTKNVITLLLKLLLATVIASILEYLIITFLSSKPILTFKAQMILAVVYIAFLLHIGYKVWCLFDLENLFSKNGKNPPK